MNKLIINNIPVRRAVNNYKEHTNQKLCFFFVVINMPFGINIDVLNSFFKSSINERDFVKEYQMFI